jgi:hypothetical protein
MRHSRWVIWFSTNPVEITRFTQRRKDAKKIQLGAASILVAHSSLRLCAFAPLRELFPAIVEEPVISIRA